MLIIPLPPITTPPDTGSGIPSSNSTTIIHRVFADGFLVDPTSVKLSSPNGVYGVRRADNDAIVVADGTAMAKESQGVYTYTFTDPAPRLLYEYWVEYQYGGETHHVQGYIQGSQSPDGNIYTLLPRCVPYLPGIPDPVLRQQLRQAASEFFRESYAWKVSVDIEAVTDQTDYVLSNLPSDTVAGAVLECNVEAAIDDRGMFVLSTAYKDGYNIESVVALLPKETCVDYPLATLSEYSRVIADLTIANCKTMAGKPWASEDWAVYYKRAQSGISLAKMTLARPRAAVVLNTQYPEAWR